MEGIRNWIRQHPDLWEFILFNLLSNCAAITNFVIMRFFELPGSNGSSPDRKLFCAKKTGV